MPRFEITAPDGKRYEITAPEGATEQQALAHFQSQFKAAPVDPYKETAQKQSIGQNLLAGIGGGMTGLYLGAKQMLGKATPEEIAQHKQAMEGLRSTKAGLTGDIIGNIVAALPLSLIPGVNTYLGATTTGAALGALKPTGEDESRAENMALGAVGGAAGKYVGDKIIGALRGQGNADNQLALGRVEQTAGLKPQEQAVLNRAQKMGFQATPGQAAGSKSLQKFEAALESNPFTSGAFEDIKRHNAGVLNKIAAKSIGETADDVSAPVLEAAKTRIAGIYRMVADNKPREINTPFVMNKIERINKDLEGVLPANVSFMDNPLVKNFTELVQSGSATGKQLQQMASKLSRASYKNMTGQGGDRDLGIALAKLKDVVDEHLKKGLSGNTLKLFNSARDEYRNLMTLTGSPGVVNSSSGDVMKNGLARTLASKDKAGYVFNRNQSDLYNAARFAEAFKPVVGDSGTATRSMSDLSLENLAKLPFGLVARLYLSQPSVAAAGFYGGIQQNGISPLLGQAMQPITQRALPVTGGYIGSRLND